MIGTKKKTTTTEHHNDRLPATNIIVSELVRFHIYYQYLTNFIWPFVGYQVSVDLSKLIPYMHQTWKHKHSTQGEYS